MKTKMVRIITAIFLVTMLFSGLQTETTSAATSSTTTLVNNQISKIKRTTISGYKAQDVKSAYFTGKSTPEILTIYSRFNKDFSVDTMIRVYSFNTKTKQWGVAYS